MPLPKPKQQETKQEFINRCMADPITNKDFPTANQRFAVCNSQWKEKK